MHVTEKGQVTIPKHIRTAAGVAPGSEVAFSLEGSKIIITPVGTSVRAYCTARTTPRWTSPMRTSTVCWNSSGQSKPSSDSPSATSS